jgi:hypothetical protein
MRRIATLAASHASRGAVTRSAAELLTGIERVSKALVGRSLPPHAPGMFVVTEADAAAIRAVYQQRGEFAAAVELRRQFPGITDNRQARECVRTIASWKPLPLRAVKRMPRPTQSE